MAPRYESDYKPDRITLRLTTLAILILALLAGLPLAVWLDLRNLTEATVSRQVDDLNSVVTSIRTYYAQNVVGRVLAAGGKDTKVVHNYEAVPGAIPIPATLSLELGRVIGENQGNITYRFVSDFPFDKRAPHALDAFEKKSLEVLRAMPDQRLIDVSASGWTSRVRLIAPVVMGAACVECHNSHPESPKRDWKVGDVRGIQELSVTQDIASNVYSFKFILSYLLVAAAAGLGFILLQRRQAKLIGSINDELKGKNDFLAAISQKLARYLAPQVFRSIFSGETEVTIHAERKKLSIFFSDIKDFTAMTERLQPEEITALLNEYFTEMSAIALKHGGTIDKFIGDAILVFFGDPETKGDAEDAKACIRMAIEMQQRISELNVKWRREGTEEPFRVRMGINTGYCNVGNFGSNDRMDYTILGAEANLAARLQSIAGPGRIVVSYDTYALALDIISAHALPPISMKGIAREVVPYTIDGLRDAEGNVVQTISEHSPGLDLYLDLGRVDVAGKAKVKDALERALKALDERGSG